VKILATGTAGMLGSALVPALRAAGHDVCATDLLGPVADDSGDAIERLDVRSESDIDTFMQRVRPDLVVHLAAETSLEACELDPDHAWLTNAVGTKLVALSCRRQAVPLAYVSTAGVFDGTKPEPYHEFDEPRPLNVYGRSKHAGERLVQQLVPESYVVRAGWMVGGGPKDHKFVAKILQQLASGATTVYAVGDKLGTPTYAPDFARCFEALVRSESFGLYHMACEGSCSRYDVTAAILDALGRGDVSLVEVGSDHFADEYFAPRPRSEIMRNMFLDLQGMNTMRDWRVALADYLARDFADHARGAGHGGHDDPGRAGTNPGQSKPDGPDNDLEEMSA